MSVKKTITSDVSFDRKRKKIMKFITSFAAALVAGAQAAEWAALTDFWKPSAPSMASQGMWKGGGAPDAPTQPGLSNINVGGLNAAPDRPNAPTWKGDGAPAAPAQPGMNSMNVGGLNAAPARPNAPTWKGDGAPDAPTQPGLNSMNVGGLNASPSSPATPTWTGGGIPDAPTQPGLSSMNMGGLTATPFGPSAPAAPNMKSMANIDSFGLGGIDTAKGRPQRSSFDFNAERPQRDTSSFD